MRKNAYILLLFSFIFSLVSCGNNEPKVYTNIEGSWRCEETIPYAQPRTYIVDVDRRLSDTTQYLISNFYNVDYDEFIYVKLTGSNVVIIGSQQIGFTQPIIVRSGSGTVSSDFKQISLDYNIYDGQERSVHAVYSR